MQLIYIFIIIPYEIAKNPPYPTPNILKGWSPISSLSLCKWYKKESIKRHNSKLSNVYVESNKEYAYPGIFINIILEFDLKFSLMGFINSRALSKKSHRIRIFPFYTDSSKKLRDPSFLRNTNGKDEDL